MPAIVNSVLENSIAEELEIQKGDELLSVDGNKMQDMIDYNFYMKSELITIEIKKANGELEEIEIEKDYDEDLGIVFESAVFDKINDDTYITLTNFKDEDRERIKKMHLGPFYVSVHTTNPELRVKMLRNPNAGKALDNLEWFKQNEIPFHAQIVLCPGLNDGKELDRTLSDLAKLGDSVLSTAIVPVGITQFRPDGELTRVDKQCAEETLKISSKYERVCCSDEFFLLAGEPIPPSEYYGNFSQLDDGVGALRLTLDDFYNLELPKNISKPFKFIFACSYAAKDMLTEISEQLNKIENLTVEVHPVKSNYWGQDITVAGLITTDDLIDTVKDVNCDMVVIPSIMLRPYTEDFLDGKNLDYVKEKSRKDFFVQQNIYSLKEVVEFISKL